MSQCPATADVEGDTVRCWRTAGHEYTHIAPDGTRWIGPERPASAPLLDADGPSGQRQPENPSDDYPPYNQTATNNGEHHEPA